MRSPRAVRGTTKPSFLDTAGVSITLGIGIEYAAGDTGNDTLYGSALTAATARTRFMADWGRQFDDLHRQ
jgi:hypothetical protein